jgi:hypothetical protein
MSHDPTDLQAEEQQTEKTQREARVAANKELANFKWQMGSKQGREYMYGLLARAGIYLTSFTSNGALTSFNEGQRFVGLYYVDLINAHCLDEFVMMLKENAPK